MNMFHSMKAWHDNEGYHMTNIKRAVHLIRQSKGYGLSAKKMAEITGLSEHKSCASALSNALKQNDSIIYKKDENSTHGRYYETDKFMWYWHNR